MGEFRTNVEQLSKPIELVRGQDNTFIRLLILFVVFNQLQILLLKLINSILKSGHFGNHLLVFAHRLFKLLDLILFLEAELFDSIIDHNLQFIGQ